MFKAKEEHAFYYYVGILIVIVIILWAIDFYSTRQMFQSEYSTQKNNIATLDNNQPIILTPKNQKTDSGKKIQNLPNWESISLGGHNSAHNSTIIASPYNE